jgi:hypothetical protein
MTWWHRDRPPTIAWNGGEFTFTYRGETMIANLSQGTSSAMLAVLSELLNGGSIELLSLDGEILVVLPLSDPAAKVSDGGELEFFKITEGTAIAQGNAEIARLLAADGEEVLNVDVGDEGSDAIIKFASTTIHQGDPVRINSFKLALP